MNVAKAFVCHTFIGMIRLKSPLHIAALEVTYRNIAYSLFYNSPKARDVLYGIRNPEYLDSLLNWAREVVCKVTEMYVDFGTKFMNFIVAETGIPTFDTCKEYEDYNERQNHA